MKKIRVRAQAPIDEDAASPDSIEAASQYLTRSLHEQANAAGVALDWATWRTYARKNRHGDLIITQWAKVLSS